MTPTPSPTPAAPYLSVFSAPSNAFQDYGWVWVIVSAVVAFLGIFLVVQFDQNARLRRTGILLSLVGVVSLFAIPTVWSVNLFTGNNPLDIQYQHMSANLTQKYNAKLIPDEFKKIDDSELTQPHEYKLAFPDGTQGTYYIKWDQTTSEPTIINKSAPTPDQLNQNANKR